jgi:hypothetical protein
MTKAAMKEKALSVALRFAFAAVAWAVALFVSPMLGALVIVAYLGCLDTRNGEGNDPR